MSDLLPYKGLLQEGKSADPAGEKAAASDPNKPLKKRKSSNLKKKSSTLSVDGKPSTPSSPGSQSGKGTRTETKAKSGAKTQTTAGHKSENEAHKPTRPKTQRTVSGSSGGSPRRDLSHLTRPTASSQNRANLFKPI